MLQFPKTTHVTLPSVEQWGTNANILRDPPKSLFTRRIDKVGQNMDITSLVDSSGDRAAEGILVYSRGINPMVSVSYSNQSNNAGISGNPTATSGQTQAYLPYSVMEGGAFRPPVRNPRDLLPLSRLPRVWFSADSSKSSVDYSKTKQQPYDYRAVKDDVIHAFNVRPNRTADISAKLTEHFKMMDKINDKHISVSANAGTASRDITSFTRDNVDRNKGAMDDALHAFAQSNKGQSISHTLDNLSIDEKRYIHDVLQAVTNTNRSASTAQTLDNLSIDQKRYIQNVLQAATTTNRSANTAQNLENLSIDQVRYIQNVLQAPSTTNRSADINAKTADQLNDANRRMTVKADMIQYATEAGINTGVTFLNEMAEPVLVNRAIPQHAQHTQVSDSTRHHRVAHEKELEFQRNIPLTHVTANITKLDDFDSMMLSSRDARINRPELHKGSFTIPGSKPTYDRSDQIDLLSQRETDKDRLRRAMLQ